MKNTCIFQVKEDLGSGGRLARCLHVAFDVQDIWILLEMTSGLFPYSVVSLVRHRVHQFVEACHGFLPGEGGLRILRSVLSCS